MKLKYFVCALSTATDTASNRVSIFHIFEDIQVAAFPVVIGNMTVLAHLTKEPSEADRVPLTIKAKLKGAELLTVPIEAVFAGLPNNRITAEFQGIVIPTDGDLIISLSDAQDMELGSWTIQVARLTGAAHAPVEIVQAPAPTPSSQATANTVIDKNSKAKS